MTAHRFTTLKHFMSLFASSWLRVDFEATELQLSPIERRPLAILPGTKVCEVPHTVSYAFIFLSNAKSSIRASALIAWPPSQTPDDLQQVTRSSHVTSTNCQIQNLKLYTSEKWVKSGLEPVRNNQHAESGGWNFCDYSILVGVGGASYHYRRWKRANGWGTISSLGTLSTPKPSVLATRHEHYEYGDMSPVSQHLIFLAGLSRSGALPNSPHHDLRIFCIG